MSHQGAIADPNADVHVGSVLAIAVPGAFYQRPRRLEISSKRSFSSGRAILVGTPTLPGRKKRIHFDRVIRSHDTSIANEGGDRRRQILKLLNRVLARRRRLKKPARLKAVVPELVEKLQPTLWWGCSGLVAERHLAAVQMLKAMPRAMTDAIRRMPWVIRCFVALTFVT